MDETFGIHLKNLALTEHIAGKRHTRKPHKLGERNSWTGNEKYCIKKRNLKIQRTGSGELGLLTFRRGAEH